MTATRWPGTTEQRAQRRSLNVGRAYWHKVGDELRPGWIDDALRMRTPKRDRWIWAARYADDKRPVVEQARGQYWGLENARSVGGRKDARMVGTDGRRGRGPGRMGRGMAVVRGVSGGRWMDANERDRGWTEGHGMDGRAVEIPHPRRGRCLRLAEK